MRTPPQAGSVVRFDYLWRDEKLRGRIEGSKDRPCVIVVAIDEPDNPVPMVILAAVTHSPPAAGDDAIELPTTVKAALRLDDARSWIVVTEINRVRWNDPGFVPIDRGGWSYGRLPEPLWREVRDTIRSRATAGRLAAIARTS